jgi:hypothetical protein
VLEGELQKSIVAFQLQLFTHMCPVILDRPETEVEIIGDFFARFVVRKHPQNTPFRRTELLQ